MSENVYCRICDFSFLQREAVRAQYGDVVHWLCPCCGADVCPPGDTTSEDEEYDCVDAAIDEYEKDKDDAAWAAYRPM